VVLDNLRNAAEKHHLTFGPDPASHSRCTLGGMIGNNSCGVHSVMAGKTDENIEALDVLTYDGVRLKVGATSIVKLNRSFARRAPRRDLQQAQGYSDQLGRTHPPALSQYSSPRPQATT